MAFSINLEGGWGEGQMSPELVRTSKHAEKIPGLYLLCILWDYRNPPSSKWSDDTMSANKGEVAESIKLSKYLQKDIS